MSPCTELLSHLECSWASDLVTSLPRDLQAVTDPQPIWVILNLASPTHRLKLTFPGHPGGTVRDSTWEQGATVIPAPSDPRPLALFPQMLSCLEHMYHDLGLVRDFSINPITLRRWLVSEELTLGPAASSLSPWSGTALRALVAMGFWGLGVGIREAL